MADQDSDDDMRRSSKNISILKVLKIPTIWFSFLTFIVATVCNGFLSINLEPKVRPIMIIFEAAAILIFPLFRCCAGSTSTLSTSVYCLASKTVPTPSRLPYGATCATRIEIQV
jgi:hypothetical protein